MNASDMLRQLVPLADRDTRKIAHGDQFSFVSAFVARQTETIQTIAMPVAGLLIVIEGLKTLCYAGRTFTYGPGEAFALPGGTSVAVVNEPHLASGVYRGLFLGFSTQVLQEARRRWSSLAAGYVAPDPTIRITPALASAILHTSEALAGTVAVSAGVKEQRLLEILLVLAESGAAPLRPDMKHMSVTEAVRFTLRHAPAKAWSVGEVARELHRSEPTLRRNLREEGTNFTRLLAEIRMQTACSMLTEAGSNVSEAAIAGGYASSSHFAKRFRNEFGSLPSQIKRGRPHR